MDRVNGANRNKTTIGIERGVWIVNKSRKGGNGEKRESHCYSTEKLIVNSEESGCRKIYLDEFVSQK